MINEEKNIVGEIALLIAIIFSIMTIWKMSQKIEEQQNKIETLEKTCGAKDL